MFLRNYGFRNAWLDKHLKKLASEDHSATIMVHGPKHC